MTVPTPHQTAPLRHDAVQDALARSTDSDDSEVTRPGDCHRKLVADWLAERGWEVVHIV